MGISPKGESMEDNRLWCVCFWDGRPNDRDMGRLGCWPCDSEEEARKIFVSDLKVRALFPDCTHIELSHGRPSSGPGDDADEGKETVFVRCISYCYSVLTDTDAVMIRSSERIESLEEAQRIAAPQKGERTFIYQGKERHILNLACIGYPTGQWLHVPKS